MDSTAMHTKIADVLRGKEHREVHGVAPAAPVAVAVALMKEHEIGSVLVREGTRIAGILTERDLARGCVQPEIDITSTRCEEVMTFPLAFVSPTTSVGDALKVMSETHCRHLPVMDAGDLVGIISLGDLLRWMTDELSAHVFYLESYICGR